MKQRDFDVLLEPIPGATPVGVDCRDRTNRDAHETWQSLKSEAADMRRGDEVNFEEFRRKCTEFLRTTAKDVEVACWFVEAVCHEQESPSVAVLESLAAGLGFIQKLMERYDAAGLRPDWIGSPNRVGALERLLGSGRNPVVLRIRKVSLTGFHKWTSPNGKTFERSFSWDERARIKQVEGAGTDEIRNQFRNEGYPDESVWEEAINSTDRVYHDSLVQGLAASKHAAISLRDYVIQTLRSVPQDPENESEPFHGNDLIEFLEGIEIGIAVDSIDPGGILNDSGAAPDVVPMHGETRTFGGASNVHLSGADRAEALRQLRMVGQYFRTTEPHSPIGFGILRLLRWAETPLPELLKELVGSDAASESVLGSMNRAIGIDRPAAGSGDNKSSST